jgi:hypothetical protein
LQLHDKSDPDKIKADDSMINAFFNTLVLQAGDW